jgi:hypothetical protein
MAERLQEANALLQTSRSLTAIVGAALGGVLVVAIGAGATLAVDAASFAVSAVLLARLRLERRSLQGPGIARELVEGWREFRSRTWVWSTVVFFAFYTVTGNAIFLTVGPLVASESLGGAPAWGAILTGQAIGAVAGAVVALRLKPARPLRLCFLSLPLLAPAYVALAVEAPVALAAAAAALAGVVAALFTVLWETALQEHIPAAAISRVSAYDRLGSLTLAPLGLIIAPLAARAIGISTALWLTAAAMCACALVGVAVRDVRDLGHPAVDVEPTPAPA